MAQANSLHVVPNADGWALKSPHQEQPVSRHGTQEEAISAGRRAMHEQGGGELLIHARTGEIRDKVTIAPGHDPYPPEG